MVDCQVELCRDFGLATVMLRRGARAQDINLRLRMQLPGAPAWCEGPDGLMMIGTGPGHWLAYTHEASSVWARDLTARLSGIASVSDQSGAYQILRMSGRSARAILQRGSSIDLHPDEFGPGDAASSVIEHVGISFWQVSAHPSFELAVPRSFYESFTHWLNPAVASVRSD